MDLAFRIALARPPDVTERQKALDYLRGSPDALPQFCHLMFNLNEFVYRQ